MKRVYTLSTIEIQDEVDPSTLYDEYTAAVSEDLEWEDCQTAEDLRFRMVNVYTHPEDEEVLTDQELQDLDTFGESLTRS